MSNNTAAKDKLILDLTDPKKVGGKINLDPTDSSDVTEMFSRMAPGDKGSCKIKFSLDDAGEKVLTLSIEEIEFDPADEESTGDDEEDETDKDDDEEAEGETPAAVTMMKNEDGVPEGEDNMPPPDSMPMR